MTGVSRWAAGLVAAVALCARSARAQDEEQATLGVKSVGSYLSYTWIDHARNGWDLGADVDVGSVVTPRAHILLEANYLHADLDRSDIEGTPLQGSFHDFSVSAALRVTLVHAARVEPYIGAGVGLHFLGNDFPAGQPYRDDYRGTKVGGEYFGGVSFDLTKDRRWALYGELRRIEVSTVPRTTVRAGFFVRL